MTLMTILLRYISSLCKVITNNNAVLFRCAWRARIFLLLKAMVVLWVILSLVDISWALFTTSQLLLRIARYPENIHNKSRNVKLAIDIVKIFVYYNGVQKVTYSKSGSGWYFKAGSYTQSNPSKGDGAGTSLPSHSKSLPSSTFLFFHLPHPPARLMFIVGEYGQVDIEYLNVIHTN